MGCGANSKHSAAKQNSWGTNHTIAKHDEKSVRIWDGVGEPDFVFPEMRKGKQTEVAGLLGKANLAICISGGGQRASACAVGWFQVLHELGLVDQARYICSNSGGSWFNTAWSYNHKVDRNTFLGKYIEPSKLTMASVAPLSKSDLEYIKVEGGRGGSYAACIARCYLPSIKEFMHLMKEGHFDSDVDRNVLFWSDMIGDYFHGPYGLNDQSAVVGLAQDAASLKKRFPKATGVITTCKRNKDGTTEPYPIVVGCLYTTNDPCKVGCNGLRIQSVEMTPQYYGVPTRQQDTEPCKVGGSLVEVVAMSAQHVEDTVQNELPAEKFGDNVRERLVKISWAVPLVQFAGISSHALAATGLCTNDLLQDERTTDSLGNKIEEKCDPFLGGVVSEVVGDVVGGIVDGIGDAAGGFSKSVGAGDIFQFPKLDYLAPDNKLGRQGMYHMDGGVTDNLAIFPALRRKVDHVLLLWANGNLLSREDGKGFKSAGEWSSECYDAAGLWGAVESVVHVHVNHNKHSKVFKSGKEGWQQLVNDLENKIQTGKPCVLQRTEEVVDNANQGIIGGWNVKLFIVCNYTSKAYLDALPSVVRERIKATTEDEFSYFMCPCIPAGLQQLPQDNVHILGNNAAFSLMEHSEDLKSFFEDANAALRRES